MARTLRRRILAGLLGPAVLLSLGGIAWLLLPASYLEIVDDKNGRRYGLFRVEEGTRVRLSWNHSIEHTPWVEQYQIQGMKLVLTTVRVKSFGAGVDVEAPESEVEGGWVVMRKMNRTFDSLHFVYSQRVNHRLLIGNRDADLKSRIPHHSPVEVRLRKIPRIMSLIE